MSAISHDMHKLSILDISFNITDLCLLIHPPGANELVTHAAHSITTEQRDD